MELALPNIRNCHLLNPQKILELRENTHDLRKDFLQGLSKIYTEYLADLEPSKYGQTIKITEEVLPMITDYSEEMKKVSTNKSKVSNIRGELFGFFAEAATLGTIHLCLPGGLDPLGSMAVGVVSAGAATLVKSIYEQIKHRPPVQVQNPLSSVVFYMEDLKKLS